MSGRGPLQPFRPDTNPSGASGADAASASLLAAKSGVPHVQVVTGAPCALEYIWEGRRTPSTALGRKMRSTAAMARVQGRPPTQSPGLLGEMEHLQAVRILSPHSIVEPDTSGSFISEKEKSFGHNSPDLIHLPALG